jgi:glycogen synthase
MSKIRILYVASEIDPFLQTSEVANFVRKLPQAMQEKGMEIRILVPRFGIINERKNRLHEVVRLSGINISVGDEILLIMKTIFTASLCFTIKRTISTKTMTSAPYSSAKE